MKAGVIIIALVILGALVFFVSTWALGYFAKKRGAHWVPRYRIIRGVKRYYLFKFDEDEVPIGDGIFLQDPDFDQKDSEQRTEAIQKAADLNRTTKLLKRWR